MPKKVDDGGPAFPTDRRVHVSHCSTGDVEVPLCESGMTLRDWFAGLAMIGFLCRPKLESPRETAEDAYMAADALLRHRREEESRERDST